MPRLEFFRADFHLAVQPAEGGGALIRFGPDGNRHEYHIDRELLELLRAETPESLLPLMGAQSFAEVVRDWQAPAEERREPTSPNVYRVETLPRIVLDVADPALAEVPWEYALSLLLPPLPWQSRPYSFVRTSSVWPRFASVPFTLPLRILHVEPPPGGWLKEKVRQTLGSSLPDDVAARAMQVYEVGLDAFKGCAAPHDEPTAEVLHFDRLPALAEPATLVSTAEPERPGTLGWFTRVTDLWQTRLVVITCRERGEAGAARRLASALVNRGGPAVLVGYFPEEADTRGYYGEFYDLLIHDFPLDAIIERVPDRHAVKPGLSVSLFVGAGREEGLRVSTLGIKLLDLGKSLSPEQEEGKFDKLLPVDIDRELVEDEASASDEALASLEQLGGALSYLKQEWKDMYFESHEGEGLIPLSRTVSSIRASSLLRPLKDSETAAPKTAAPRYVNSSLWEVAEDETLRQFARETARLRVGETYHLGIQIGPEDVRFSAIGATALIEEIFKWTPEMKGAWVEIGVSGIDFDVLGEPVQELWLPRDAPSEFIYFPISPRVCGAARLRFCLYYKQNLIQSFRLAAFTLKPDQKDEPLKRRKRLLASALGLTQKAVGGLGYLSRLEYSLTAAAEGIETRPERSLSIAANDLNGLQVVTLKGQDQFSVILPGNVSKQVREVRQAMKEVSAIPVEGETDPSKWNYAFGPYAMQPKTLKDALKKLARVGWLLYDQLIQGDDQMKLETLLPAERGTIHVAHILRDKVIPWAALYDRPYEPDTQETIVDGEEMPTLHGVCLAAMPGPDGQLPVSECGKHPNCPLHEDRRQAFKKKGKAVLPETVVCPLRFWGFKHIIEVPPQQVTAGGSARPQRDCVLYAGQTPQLAVGYNACLGLWDDHWKELETLTQWKTKIVEKRRARILQALMNEELDIVYFYCHARGGLDDAAGNPEHLLFQAEAQAKAEKLTASGFPRELKWKHQPLVILNGCGTVGFSPDALSPFLKKLVDDLGAAGVLGTEVTIWEELATQASIYFLRQFLAGKPAGEALLTMRRTLLAGKNPLGLVYTLYAPAHLRLDQTGEGKCQNIN
jgi:CHAT domain